VSTDHVELKALTSRKEQAERRLEALHEEQSALEQKIRGEQKDLGSIRAQIEKLTRKKKVVVVSEHAILRYLERVKGIDIEATKKEILPEAVGNVAAELGTGEFPAGTHSVKVKDSVVVTILTKEKKP
jgi:predicted  nucleic acid-binding Zn-ribbon protein